MELRLFLHALARGWIILVIALALGIALAVAHVKTTPPSYQSVARIYVNAKSASNISDLTQANALSQQVVTDYAELAATPYVLEPAVRASGLPITEAELASAVTASVSADTTFLNLTAVADSPAKASRMAEAVSQSLVSGARRLAGTSGQNTSLQLTEVQPASVPTVSTSGSLSSELPLGAVIGLVVGIALVVLRERMRTQFTGVARIAVVTDADVVGTFPVDRRAKRVPALQLPRRSPVRFEAFRSLRTAVQGLGVLPDGGGVVVAVTSSVPGEGKSSTVAGLAVAVAASGRDVVVIEGDLRRPRVARSFGIAQGAGLTDVLAGNATLAECMQATDDARISVLRAGSALARCDELVESDAMARLLAELAGGTTVVLVDTPPLLALSDAASIAKRADHVLLVVGAPIVREGEAARALEVLRQVGVRVAGVVVNRVPHAWAEAGASAYPAYLADPARRPARAAVDATPRRTVSDSRG